MSDERADLRLRKRVEEIRDLEGQGTELVTLFIPPGDNLQSWVRRLSSEYSEAGNIKSKRTRTNVQSALKKAKNLLQQYKQTPENGLVVFTGQVDDEFISLIFDDLPHPISESNYICDDHFHTEPVESLVTPDEAYGLIVVTRDKATIGLLVGDRIETVREIESLVMGKTRAGGQCMSPGTLVVAADGRMKTLEEIHVGDQILAADTDARAVTTATVTAKWNEHKRMYAVNTKHAAHSFEASGDHTVFRLHEDGVERVAVSEIESGDSLLAPTTYGTRSEEVELPASTHANTVSISDGGRAFFKRRRAEHGLSQSAVDDECGMHQASVSSMEVDDRPIGQQKIDALTDVYRADTDEFLREYMEPANLTLPEQVTRRLAELLGYFAGDGHFDDSRIGFSEGSQRVARRYGRIAEGLFDTTVTLSYRDDKNYYSLCVGGRPITRLIESEFPELGGSRDTPIPAKVLRCGDEVVAGFLRGLYDAEGWTRDDGRVRFAVNNRRLAREVQLALRRLDVVASYHVDEDAPQRSDITQTARHILSISDGQSLRTFAESVGLTGATDDIDAMADERTGGAKSRTVPFDGRTVRSEIEAAGMQVSDFHGINRYLQGNGNVAKQTLRTHFADSPMAESLDRFCANDFAVTTVTSVEPVGRDEAIDIETTSGNFIADGVLVHNSAQRFKRIREKQKEEHFKDVAAAAADAFLDDEGEQLDVEGVLIGGTDITVDDFVSHDWLDYRITENTLGKFNVAHGDRTGLKQLVDKAESVLRADKQSQARELMGRFMQGLRGDADPPVAYGDEEVDRALEYGAVDTLLLSESLDGDRIDDLSERAENIGSDVQLVSTAFEEGEQLRNVFGGVAAVLRYEI